MRSEAERLRDEALASISRNNKVWLHAGRILIAHLKHFHGTGEDLRILLTSMGLPPPKHHNAWGALVRSACHRNLLIGTGHYVQMRTPKSHGRRSEILRRP